MSTKAMIASFLLITAATPVVCQEPKGEAPRNIDSGAGPRPNPKTFKQIMGPDFTVSPLADSPILFSVTLSDKTTGRNLTSMYNRTQLELIQAILIESQKFAQTGEAVGATKPRITRFFNENEPTFFVDVSKMGKTSQYFVTMKSPSGHLTLDCGTIKRGDPSSDPPFVDSILAKLIEATGAKQ